MQAGIRDLKSALRSQMRSALRSLPPEYRRERSGLAAAHLISQAGWQSAGAVLFYAPLPDELDLWPLLKTALAEGKEVALPRFDPETGAYVACQITDCEQDVARGRYGIREAACSCREVPLNRLDLALIPGVAFDSLGRRLGRGKGYYDRWLPDLRGLACGVGFDEQLVPEVPVEQHDVQLNCILTPTRWIQLYERPVVE